MNDVFLQMKGIQKHFGGVNALAGVDLTIRRGEIHCLAGENGSGKSPLIKVIAGVHPASAGEIYIEGVQIPSLSP
ncbi:MAG: ATP-binding cassette domain-containing protein, partial [Candidatus Limiplasma sp.]|nr:ATP-binding cassette domain-containing protein [Candidatus Limiplasma sp.]